MRFLSPDPSCRSLAAHQSNMYIIYINAKWNIEKITSIQQQMCTVEKNGNDLFALGIDAQASIT